MKPIEEYDLHAYADGQLDSGRRAEVESWLAQHPREAVRVQAWVGQNRALHAAFDPVLDEPVPLALVRAASPRRKAAVPRSSWRAAAAVLIALASGGLGYGLGLSSATVPMAIARLPQEAAIAHVVYSPEKRHPVEVDARHADHLVAWLSKRLGTPLSAPDFRAQGFDLLGGRLLPGSTGAVAQFMYQDGGGQRVTLYVRRDGAGGETGFRHAREDGVEVFYWIDRELGYALSGQVEHGVMQRLADAAYLQVGRH